MQKFQAGFLTAIVLVLITGAISFFTLREQISQAAKVKHTYEVLGKLESFEKILGNMENGRRGYRSTYDSLFLQPYLLNKNKWQPALLDLKEKISDNPSQLKRLSQLREKVESVDHFWEHNYTTVNTTLGERQQLTIREKAHMDQVRSVLNAMRDEEELLLTSRTRSNARAAEQAIWTIIISTLLTITVVIILIIVIIKEFRARRKAQAALEENLTRVTELNEEAGEKNWQLTGIAHINAALQDTTSPERLAGSCLNVILDYLDYPAGAFYGYNAHSRSLEMIASSGLPANAPSNMQLSEGLLGHSATLKTIRVIGQVPDGYWQLSSAAGSYLPTALIHVPLWLNQEFVGIIELAGFNGASSRNLALLELVANNIAIGLNAAYNRKMTSDLLMKVQEQNEELESQQEELRQTNEELTRQAEILQASEEELRVQEEELRQINAELEEKNEAVETAREELAGKAKELELSNRYKSEFLANMSHELRTPLNSILILSNILQENKTGNLNEKQLEYARIIHRSGSDLLQLINDILDLSKIEAGKIDIRFEHVAFKEITEDLRHLFQPVAADKGVGFRIEVDPDLPTHLFTDKQRLEQIIRNLLSNAFKFTGKSGSVALQLSSMPAERVRISVTDTGIGIPEEKQQLIFEAFQQADGSVSRKYGGTGLGLSISKELAAKLGGSLALQSQEGQGSTFSLMLPIGIVSEKSSGAQSDGTQSQKGEALSDDRERISAGDKVMLIIENDPVFASALRDIARSRGYKTIVALRGDDGLEDARKYLPTAIVMDVNLPVIDGKSLLKIFRNDDQLKNVPVHIISGTPEESWTGKLKAGFSQKPLNMAGLEHAFDSIGKLVRSRHKQILVISGSTLLEDNIRKIFGQPDVRYWYAKSPSEAGDLMREQKFDCLIVDMDKNIETGLQTLQQTAELKGAQTPVIAYLSQDITQPDEIRIRKYANAIVRHSQNASSRLIDELELFLYKLEQLGQLPPQIRNSQKLNQALRGKKVLVADDDMRNVFALHALLEEEGMKVITAGNGREAITALEEHTDTDLVLMDIMMPEMDGLQATRAIRDQSRFKTLPIIALTAKAMTGDREKCIEAGASDYITKPLDNQKLLSMLTGWLSK